MGKCEIPKAACNQYFGKLVFLIEDLCKTAHPGTAESLPECLRQTCAPVRCDYNESDRGMITGS